MPPAAPDVDVAVVGGGPAGALAAYEAARAGARTVLLERARLPRYKTCGGGLVTATQEALPVSTDGLTRAAVDRVTVTLRGRLAVTRASSAPFLHLVMRADLDAALVRAAHAAGAEVRTGTTVTALEQTDDRVVVRTRDGDVTARAVVGADGASGRTAAHVGVRVRQVDLGLETEVPVDAPAATEWAGRVLLDWGPVRGSYGWVFAKGPLLSAGVIGPREDGPALRAYHRAFLARHGLDPRVAEHDSGHLTRCREPGSPLRRGRVLVAGDAAGLLEPWTREGISYAVRSGSLAGRVAARVAREGPRAADAYRLEVEHLLGPEQAAGARLLTAFERVPWLFQGLIATPGGWRLLRDLVGHETTLAAQVRRPLVRAGLRAVRA